MNPTPPPVELFGKLLLGFGMLVALIGALMWAGGKLLGAGGWRLLPGDIYIKKSHFVFFFPLGTSIVLSILLSLLLTVLVFLSRR